MQRQQPSLKFGDERIHAKYWKKVIECGDGCWLWVGAKARGYGHIRRDGKDIMAHRLFYSTLVGPITEPTIDHLCRVPACVRPDHLEPVSYRENLLRGNTLTAQNAAKTTCPRGHPYDARSKYGARGRYCTRCSREFHRIVSLNWWKKHRQKKENQA